MIIQTKKFKQVCSKLLSTINSSELSTLKEYLELKTENDYLYLNVSNEEYYASIKFKLDHTEDFNAVVNANLFLKLISQLTSETIQLKTSNNYINIKANGTYKIPLIYDDDGLVKLKPIDINEPVVSMDISGSILLSILQYNSKELTKESVVNPLQTLYYLDQNGCITFTSSACVNNFILSQPVKLLLNNRLVRLFKLFDNDMVKLTLGYTPISDYCLQTRLRLETEDVAITAKLVNNENDLNNFPVDIIRDRANHTYTNSITINKSELIQAINRIILLNNNDSTLVVDFVFNGNTLTIRDGSNEELLTLEDTITDEVVLPLNIYKLKITLDVFDDNLLTWDFGNNEEACVLSRAQIKNVIPLEERM